MIEFLAAMLLSSSQAPAATSDFECFKEGVGSEICIVIPDDAPAAVRPPPAQKTISPAPKEISMLSRSELDGKALDLENEFAFDTALNEAETPDYIEESINQPALVSSLKSQESVRWIETFLKTGPSSESGDIFVRPAAKPKD